MKSRRIGFSPIFPGLGRGRRESARAWAACGRYCPFTGWRLRRISRLTVDGLRPSSAAIARTVAFSRSRSAMWIRSASHKYREDAEGGTTAWIGGAALFLPDALRPLRQRLPVRGLIPTTRHASALLMPCCMSWKYAARSSESFFGP